MQRGDVVRKIMSVETDHPTEYGPYMRVVNVNRSEFVGVEYLSGHKKPSIALKSKLVVIKCSHVQITHENFAAIRHGRRTLSHLATSQWLKMYKSLPVLIQLRDFDFSDDIMLFKILDMRKRKDIWRQHDEIYIELGERLL